jgi:hypothetical protein
MYFNCQTTRRLDDEFQNVSVEDFAAIPTLRNSKGFLRHYKVEDTIMLPSSSRMRCK